MYALRERRVHVTQEDFEMAVTKVLLFCVTLTVFHFSVIVVRMSDTACINFNCYPFVIIKWVVKDMISLFYRSCKKILRRTCLLRNFGSNGVSHIFRTNQIKRFPTIHLTTLLIHVPQL